MMRILTVIGARPQFIKASVVSKALQESGKFDEVLVHTGQHYDVNMSDIFFDQLQIARPQIHLDIHGGGHGEMTGRMLIGLESVILREKPDCVMVYGDTNSTLAGALAAAKLNIPVAHVEAGLRSGNMRMPEEINRILTDQVSDVLFCPTKHAEENLQREGLSGRGSVRTVSVGDVMLDAALVFRQYAERPTDVPKDTSFILATAHRAENTDDGERLSSIVSALNQAHKSIAPVVIPLHPRTRSAIERLGLTLEVVTIDPVGYFEMLWLLEHCGLVLTDSGGLQKEACFFNKPCVTLRDETEWIELIEVGVNELVGANSVKILDASVRRFGITVGDVNQLYGGGKAAQRVASELSR